MSSGGFKNSGLNSKTFSFGQNSLDNNSQPTGKRSGIIGTLQKITSRPTSASDPSHLSSNPVSSIMVKDKIFHQRAESMECIAQSMQYFAETLPKKRPRSWHSYEQPYHLDIAHSVHSPGLFTMETDKHLHQRAEAIQSIAETLPKKWPSSYHSYDQPYHSDLSHASTNPVSSVMAKDKIFHQKAESMDCIAQSMQYFAKTLPKKRPRSWHSYKQPYHSDIAHSVHSPGSFTMETDKPLHQRAEAIQYIAESSPKTKPSSWHSYDHPYHSDNAHSEHMPLSFAMETDKPFHQSAESSLNPELIPTEYYDIPYPSELLPKDTRINTLPNRASKPNGDASKHKSRKRVPTFKGFPLNLTDLPLTKEKCSESLLLEEACGYLPWLMHTGRDKLFIMERGLDQVCVEMQMAVRHARNICILLENAPVCKPENINDAIVQAEKMMHLIITSYRIYIKIAKSGKNLKEGLNKYRKFKRDYHTSIDNLLEFLFQTVLEKCWSF